jgi:hypothetical protein
MLRTLLILRLLISLIATFPMAFIGLGVIMWVGLMQVTGHVPAGYWEQDQKPMIHFKKIDEDLKRHGIPIRSGH